MPINMPPKHAEAETRKLSCGSCQWFSSGYKGKNCQRTREVEVTTPACREYQPIFEDPFHAVSRDKYIEGIREELQGDFAVDNGHLDEAREYIVQIDDFVSNLGRQAEYNLLKRKLLEIVGYRARITEIYTGCIDMRSSLNEIYEKATLWLYSKHEIFREMRNEEMRNSAFNRSIPEYVPLKNSLSRLEKTLEYLDSKLDKNERVIRSIMDNNAKLVFSTERGQ